MSVKIISFGLSNWITNIHIFDMQQATFLQ